ncbi:fimbrillin family protein [Bacteroides sp.]|uniref:fimbrillin family protein n=1 Tax=Bacteroides sp. TaxID=29523 RepID=UPI00258681DB|nr:fimbrillin family protein [Bacteroides sp.]
MKTKHVWFALSALAIAGCSQNEITEISPEANPAVGFSVFTGTQTKGTITDNTGTTGIQTTGFGVLAYYTGTDDFGSGSHASPTPNFMWNQKVEYKSSAWSYTPLKYWPNTTDEKISFFAYAPYADTQSAASSSNGIELTAATASGYPKITFHWNTTTPSAGVDLVATNAAQTGGDKTINLTKQTAAVPFKFKHVLSRANFWAKLDGSVNDSETKVFIKGVKLLGTSIEAPSAANSSSKFYTKATYKWEDGTWDYTDGTQQAAAVELDGDILNKANPNFGSGSAYTTSSVAVTATAASMFKANQYLFLIPPAVNGIAASTDIRILLTYDVVTLDTKLDGGKSVIEAKSVVSLPNETLKGGSAYKYVFTIGLEGVKVSADVENWDADVNVVDAALTEDAIKDAITAFSTIKGSTSACTKFSVHVTGTVGSATTLDLSGMTTTNFVAKDCITLDFSDVTGFSTSNKITVTAPTGWSVSGSPLSSAGQITLTKN